MASGEKLVKFLMESRNQEGVETFYYGKVISKNPLKISIDSKLVLDKDFLIIGQLCRDSRGLQVDDRVFLIRSGSGQKWYCVERV